jgi:hypothetical protein
MFHYDMRLVGQFLVILSFSTYYNYDTNPICLYKQGFIDLSLILQAVKCQAASRARKAVANPTPTYAIFSNIL